MRPCACHAPTVLCPQAGELANVTYIQRLNTLGGMAPTELYALPAYNGTSNFQLAVPYQADYVFLTGGGTGGARRSL